MGDFTQQGEYSGNEIFYKSKLSLTPKRKVASPPGRIGRLFRGRKYFANRKYRLNLAIIFANEIEGFIWIDVIYF